MKKTILIACLFCLWVSKSNGQTILDNIKTEVKTDTKIVTDAAKTKASEEENNLLKKADSTYNKIKGSLPNSTPAAAPSPASTTNATPAATETKTATVAPAAASKPAAIAKKPAKKAKAKKSKK